MSSQLSNLVDNSSEGLHSDKRTDCKSCLDYTSFKDEQLIFRCFECKKNYEKDFNKDLQIYMKFVTKIFKDRFILLLRKGVYSYEYMDS